MTPLSIASAKALASNTVARWIVGIAAFVLCLWLAQCRGERIGGADATLALQDSVAKTAAAQSKAFDKVRAADLATFTDSLAAATRAKIAADSQAKRAQTVVNRISVLGPAKSPSGEAPVSSAPEPGSGPAGEPPDTVKYSAIQRQGDPRVYTIPQFVVDAGAELRKALTASLADATSAHAALDLAQLTIRADSNAIGSRETQIGALASAESAAKSKAGEGCKFALLIPCPPRTVVAIGSLLIGAAAGYELAKR